MTSAGNIKLGVEIDASDLSARLGEAVRKAIAPALAEIQRELNEVQREYDRTAKAATKSSATQVAAAKRTREALQSVVADQTQQARQTSENADRTTRSQERQRKSTDSVAGSTKRVTEAQNTYNTALDIFGKKSPQAFQALRDLERAQARHTDVLVAAAARSKASTDRQVFDYHRLARAAEQSATRQAAATAALAAATTSGGGGGGPPRVDRHQGGFLRGGRGRFGFLTSPVGLGGIALAAQSLPALATGTVHLAGAIQQLAQAGAVLPGIFAGAASSIGVAVIGFKGMGDAIKALNEAEADPEKLEKATEALKNMAPAAVEVAKEVSRLTTGPLREFQKQIAQPMFEGVAAQLGSTADKVIPRIQPGMQKIAGAWNDTFKTTLGTLGSDDTLNLVDQIFGNTAEGQTRANAAIKPFVSAFGTLAKEGSYFLPRLGDALTSVAERFDSFIQRNTDNGNIFRWIDEGLNGLRAFGNAIINVVTTVTNLTKAAGLAKNSLSGDGGFLGWLERSTKAMADFTGSAEGQNKLSKFFEGGREDMAEWGRLLKELGPVLKSVLDGFATWGEILLPVITAVASLTATLDTVPGLLEAVVVGFLAWRSIGPIISGLTTKLNTMTIAAGRASGAGGAGGVAGKGRGGQGAAGLGLLGLGSVMQHTAGQEETSSQIIGGLTTIAGGALTGAAIGSVIPGIGTAIGAGVGAGVGTAIAGLNFLLADNKTATEAAAAAADQHAASLERSRSAMNLTEQATKSANDALLGSSGAFDAASIGAVGDVISQIPDKLAGRLPEETIKGIADVMGNLGQTTEQLSTIVTGSAPQFDALIGRLQAMGEPGRILAEQLTGVRNEMLGVSQDAATAAPLLQTLADTGFGTVQQAAVGVQNALAAVPPEVPINVDAPGGQAVLDILTQLGQAVHVDNNKNIIVDAPLAPQVLEQLRALGYEVRTNNDKTITVRMDQGAYIDTLNKMGNLKDLLQSMTGAAFNVPAPPVPNAPNAGPFFIPGQPPRSAGGVLPGFSMKDNMLVPLAGGEGIIIPEAMRALGSDWLYNLNSSYRGGISRQGYADGGVHLGTGALPGPLPGADTELGVLIQIRDLLAGKGGLGTPLGQTAQNTATMATAAKAAGQGGRIGPFGTPLKPRGDPAYEMAAAAISALGGDPEKWIGTDPVLSAMNASALPTGGTGMPGAAIDTSAVAAALVEYAKTGNVGGLTGLGLDAGDPVVSAITTARNKKKGGLDDTAIASLVQQVIGGGGYTGVLDESNSTLVGALERYRNKLLKGTTGATTAATSAMPTRMTANAPGTAAGFWAGSPGVTNAPDKGLVPAAAALNDLIMQMFPAVKDIGGYRQDPHPDHPSGRALDIMIPGGTVRGGANPQGEMLGDQMWAWLQSTGIIDPQGSLWKTDTGGDHWNHIHARIAEGMENAIPNAAGLAGMGGLPTTGLPGTAGGTGTPVFVTNWPGQGMGLPPGVQGVLDAGFGAAGQAAGTVATDVTGAIAGLGQESWQKRGPNAVLSQLVDEGNPMALFEAMGFNVQDFTREGGKGGETEKREGPGYDATGRLFSDTSALFDRTLTDLHAQLTAMREQLVDVIEQVSQKLNDSALEPVIKAGMQSALESLKDSVSSAIGTALGNAAAPPIADAVSSAVSSLPIDQNGAGGVGGNLAGAAGGLLGMAGGGPVAGGQAGKDSVPALLMPGEYVLDTGDVARMGGIGAIDAMRSRGMRRFATGGGVIGNDAVGAEFFGVSEIPIISTIVNLLVRVLLQVIGIEIEVRDTLNEMTNDFRQFRGDAFKSFDAQGRLMNDTSALIERTSSSEETAAAERIRILKIVIQAIIKYIIEKVIVPITKAVANAAIQAGASAAGAAVNTQAPGAGGIVSSLISSAGQAGVEIAAEIGTDFAVAMSEQIIAVVAEGLQGAFPDLVTGIFGGGALEGLFGPTGGILTTLFGGVFGAFAALLGGGVFGGASTLIPGLPFDNGGMAEGVGFLPKATMDDELVLSPVETDLFSRFVSALERGGFGGSGNHTEVHAPITVLSGGPETAEQVENRLLKLMP